MNLSYFIDIFKVGPFLTWLGMVVLWRWVQEVIF